MMRILTSLSIIIICALTAVWGWEIAQFSRARLAAGTAGPEILRPWVGTPGLTGPTLENSLTMLAGSDTDAELRRQSDELTALLSVRPLSAGNWLALAALRLESAAPAEAVQGALTMSWLTGPNEGGLMWRRAVFGLLHWETFPEEAHRGTIRDLAGAMLGGVATGDEVTTASRLLDHKSRETRTRITELLRASGLHDKELERLGLPSAGG